MGILQNQNLTQVKVTQWESTQNLSSAGYNIIIVLGVLTFALQLCLVLYFMLRWWNLDNRMKRACKHSDTDNKLTSPTLFHLDIKKQTSYQLVNVAAAGSSHTAEDYEPTTNTVFAPYIPWDLVQR